MDIHVLSDLHFEGFQPFHEAKFWSNYKKHLGTKGDSGVQILAGDIALLAPHLSQRAFDIHSKFASEFKGITLFLPGNHEYYGSAMPDVQAELSMWRIPRWHYLQPNNQIGIGGQKFLGGTLWFDGKHARWREQYINDFTWIRQISKAYQHNLDFVGFVCQQMGPNDIIASHHLPSYQSVHPDYATSDINCFFVSDQEQYIQVKQPKLWIHGHTHHPFDYYIQKTRIYANPLGYIGEKTNPNFWDRILINV